ncbi:MAG: class I SAM-dependent methyltransferase [Verrucomicrobiales bacterium]
MHSLRVTEMAHRLVAGKLKAGEVAVDATAGNGHDTLLLAGIVGGEGVVFAFDVQACALAATGKRLMEQGLDKAVSFCQRGHENLAEVVPGCHHGRVSTVMFNLGYLPGGDKSRITQEETTLSAVGQALAMLKAGGLCTVICYPGHPGGAQEAGAVSRFIEALDPDGYRVERHEGENRFNDPPFLLAIEKLSPG